jgi:hypothetical protein
MNVQLSRSFWLHEFLRSETAARMGREIVADDDIVQSLKALCVNVLQPLRDEIGATITISSGYRPDWLNQKIGGSKTSQHMKGEAADIVAAGYTPLLLCEEIVRLKLKFDQLIYEFGPTGWTHVSCAPSPRKSILTARSVGGKTIYLKGLVRP